MTGSRIDLPGSRFDLTHEVGLEGAGRVVPAHALAVAVPELHAVLELAVLVLEVVGLAGVPVCEGDGLAAGEPEEATLLALVSARDPEMLVAKT